MSRKKPSIFSRLLWAGFGAAIALFGVALYLTPAAQDRLAAFLNSNFSTAFFGAVGGSLTIIAIEWFRRQRQVLADINTSIGVLTSLSNTLLNMKQQHVLPLVQNYNTNLNKFQTMQTLKMLIPEPKQPMVFSFEMYMKRFYCPQLHFDVPMERIFTLTDKVPQIVMIITQTKRTIGEVENACSAWNVAVEELKSKQGDDKIGFYFGVGKDNDITDTVFPDTIANLNSVVNDGLFFIKRATDSLIKLGQKTLPPWLRKKIARSEIISKEHRDLMPSDDYKEGWDNE